MKSDFEIDRDWTLGYMPVVKRILKQHAGQFISFEIASDEADRKRATDMMVKIVGGSVAVRIRRPHYTFRDLTIRAARSNGVKTELDKIREGFADWYLYAWANGNGTFEEYMLLDVHKLRASGLLENRPLKWNRDGQTAFISIGKIELYLNDCMVAHSEDDRGGEAVPAF